MSHYIGNKANEFFAGNHAIRGGAPELPAHLHQLRTARLGDQALDIDGKLIPKSDYRPLFVDRSEADLYDRIMMKRTFPNWQR